MSHGGRLERSVAERGAHRQVSWRDQPDRSHPVRRCLTERANPWILDVDDLGTGVGSVGRLGDVGNADQEAHARDDSASASPCGAVDMAGNVWEWTSSLYRPYPYDRNDGREDPGARGARVNRGGSWHDGAWYSRVSYRATADQAYRRVADLGFRCARS